MTPSSICSCKCSRSVLLETWPNWMVLCLLLATILLLGMPTSICTSPCGFLIWGGGRAYSTFFLSLASCELSCKSGWLVATGCCQEVYWHYFHYFLGIFSLWRSAVSALGRMFWWSGPGLEKISSDVVSLMDEQLVGKLCSSKICVVEKNNSRPPCFYPFHPLCCSQRCWAQLGDALGNTPVMRQVRERSTKCSKKMGKITSLRENAPAWLWSCCFSFLPGSPESCSLLGWIKARFLCSMWAEAADAPPTSELPGLPLERKEQRVLMDLCEALLIFSRQIWSNNNQTAEEAIKKNRKYGLAHAMFRNSISLAEMGAGDNSDISCGRGVDFLGWVFCRQTVDTLEWVCNSVFTFPVLCVGNAGCIFILKNKQVSYTKCALI